MNAMIVSLNSAAEIWWQRTVSVSWQAAIVGLLLLALVWFGRRWSSQVHYALLLVALIKFAVPPLWSSPTGLLSQIGPVHQNAPETMASEFKRPNSGRRPPISAELDRRPEIVALLESEPELVEPRVRRIERAVRAGRLEDARTFAGEPDDAEDPRITLARGRAELAAGEHERARQSAADAEHRLPDPWPAVVLRARSAAAAGAWGDARETIGELRGLAGSDMARLGDAEVLLGELEASGGHRGQALAAYEDAWRSFERLDALEHVAALAASLGDDGRAAAARRTLCEHDATAYCTPAP
jgi:tetratricopeptide (TPR) repeat protein